MLPAEIGERTEAAVLAALAAIGKRVLVPFGQQRFDLAYEEDGRIVKVQCKTGALRKGAVAFRTCSVGRFLGSATVRDYREDVDFFGVYCHPRREVYLIPVGDLPLRGAHLRVEPPRNNQHARVRFASDYLIWKDGSPVGYEPAQPREASPAPGQLILTNIDIGAKVSRMELPVACCAPLAASPIDDAGAEATADLFKALADPHRVKIVNLLANADEPVCVCEITPALGLSQPTTSFHLKKLVSSGLLKREQRGTWAYFSIDPDAMKRLQAVVDMKQGAVA